MSCSKCGSNGLTSCSCNDNCPTNTSELFFDGTLSSIPVPEGATVNDVLQLLETFVIQSIDELNLEYVVSEPNCLGLPAGTYGYNQIFDAVNAALCSVQSDITNIQGDITTLQGDVTTLQGDVTTLQNDVTNIQGDIVNVQTNITESMPLGSMIVFPAATPPNTKWMRCEGQAMSTAIYADLFAIIGYSFGGAGLSFNLPDLRGQFIAGYNSAGAAEYQTIGQGGGEDSVSLIKSEIPKHQHTIGSGDGATMSNPGNHDHSGGYIFNAVVEGGDIPKDATWDLSEDANPPTLSRTNDFPAPDGAHIHTGVTGDGTSDGLSGQPHENRPSFLAFPWMIKVEN